MQRYSPKASLGPSGNPPGVFMEPDDNGSWIPLAYHQAESQELKQRVAFLERKAGMLKEMLELARRGKF